MSNHRPEPPAIELSPITGEVQRHGFDFEEWVRDTFFEGYKGEYTQDWDLPATVNPRFGGIPVSIKTAKYGSSIGLGDALRQFKIEESFLLIVGFWKQEGQHKKWVNIVATEVQPAQWRNLWNPITVADIQKLDSLIKDRSLHYEEVREQAKTLKSSSPYADCLMVLNPKIDSKVQRRLQCSLPFSVLFEKLAPARNREEQESPQLFGVSAPQPFLSSSRRFNRSLVAEQTPQG
jgi:hypothetical protein